MVHAFICSLQYSNINLVAISNQTAGSGQEEQQCWRAAVERQTKICTFRSQHMHTASCALSGSILAAYLAMPIVLAEARFLVA